MLRDAIEEAARLPLACLEPWATTPAPVARAPHVPPVKTVARFVSTTTRPTRNRSAGHIPDRRLTVPLTETIRAGSPDRVSASEVTAVGADGADDGAELQAAARRRIRLRVPIERSSCDDDTPGGGDRCAKKEPGPETRSRGSRCVFRRQ